MANEFNSHEKRYHNRPIRSIGFPLILIGIGVLLLLRTTNTIDGSFWQLFFIYWPVLFIISGLDGIYSRSGDVGAMFWIVVGSVFLAANLGYLTIASWEIIIRYWPVFFLIWGGEILFHRRAAWARAAGLLFGAVLALGFSYLISYAPVTDYGVESLSVSWETSQAESLFVEVEQTTGRLELGGGASEELAVSGEIELIKQETVKDTYNVDDDGLGKFELKSDGNWVFPFYAAGVNYNSVWALAFNESIPMEMETNLIFGSQELDLTAIQLETLQSETIFGTIHCQFPSENDLDVDLKVIFGQLNIQVPKNASIVINVDTALSSVNVPEGYEKSGDLYFSPAYEESAEENIEIRAEVVFGSINIEYAE